MTVYHEARLSAFLYSEWTDKKTGEPESGFPKQPGNAATTTLGQHAAYIRENKVLRRHTDHARAVLAEYGRKSPEYDKAKAAGVIPSFGGYFAKARSLKKLTAHSGMVLLDLDDLATYEAAVAERDRLAEHPAVALSYITKSGVGVHAVVAVSPIPSDYQDHYAAWDSAFKALGVSVDLNDPACKDVSRLAFPAYDPQARYRGEVTPITWERSTSGQKAESDSDSEDIELKGIPEAFTAADLEELWDTHPPGRAMFYKEPTAEQAKGKKDFTSSGWDASLTTMGISLEQDDDWILGLLRAYNLHHGTGKQDNEEYLRRTIRRQRNWLKDNSTTGKPPLDDAPTPDPESPKPEALRKHSAADALMLDLLSEQHAATYYGCSERLVAANAERLLFASYPDKDGVTQARVFQLTPKGLWHANEPQLRARLLANEERVVKLAVGEDMASPEYKDKGKLSKQTTELLRNHSRLLNTAVPATLAHAASVPHKWSPKRRDIKDKITFAKLEQIDGDCRYVGNENGVVDLDTGDVLSRAEGRKHLVTRSTQVVYDPNATHPALDEFTSHLQPDVSAFLWQFLGRALWGAPEQFLIVVGPWQSGKSTFFSMIKSALGQLCAPFSRDLARPERSGQKSGVTPEREVLGLTRMAISSETKSWELDAEKLKTFTSGGADRITLQPKFQGEQEQVANATLIFLANSEPKMGQDWDRAAWGRMTAIHFPPPKNRNDFLKSIARNDRGLAKAALARLVQEAVANPPPRPLEKPPAVLDFERVVRINSRTEFANFADDLLERGGPDDRVLIKEVWEAWCAYHGGVATDNYVCGVQKNRVGGHIRGLFELGKSQTMRKTINAGGVSREINGKGWYRLRIAPQ